MAQSASLAEAKALQARQNLENYVFGTSVSTVPPVIPPMLPRGAATYPAFPYTSSPMQWPASTPPIGSFQPQTGARFGAPLVATASIGSELLLVDGASVINLCVSRRDRINDFF